MLLGVERLIADLRAIHQKVEGPFNSGGLRWLIVPDYLIPGGRFFGNIAKVAIAVPNDYPQTPPGGLYVSPKLVPVGDMAKLSVQDKPETAQLPGEWQYWSRPIKEGWSAENGARRIIAHWNSVMNNV